MLRYHKTTGFKKDDISKLQAFTDELNRLTYKWSLHSLDNVKHRVIDLEGLLLKIKSSSLEYGQIFEYYTKEAIEKACYRIPWNESDIILVLNEEKEIITIYLNSAEDKHSTLKKELYTIPEE